MSKHVFVIGLDDFHLAQLHSIRHAEEYTFHGLVPYKMVVNPASYCIDELVKIGLQEIEESGVTPDAIIGHWDFPTSALRVLFRREFDLPGPTLESILIAEHKYWSRLRQAKAIPENIPVFQNLDPFAEDAFDRVTLDYPFWLKPNIGFSSQMVYRIDGAEDLEKALDDVRNGIGLFGEPFGELMARCSLDDDVPEEMDAHHCILEKPIGGWQCTLEGYVRHGEVVTYGVVDSVHGGPADSTLMRYEFPSELPEPVKERMREITRRAMPSMDLDNTPFNVEYFWDQQDDQIWLLEVNTRISKSHSPLFMYVSGASHHEVAIDLAMGRKPAFPRWDGPHPAATKFMLRHTEDAVVSRVPTKEEIRSLERAWPGISIEIEMAVEKGTRLSEMRGQEVYSYEVAAIFMGGPSHAELQAYYEELVARLPLEFQDVEGTG